MPVLPTLGHDQAPGGLSRAAAAVSAEPMLSVSCEPEQETSPELTSPSGGNNPEHLEDPNVWETSLSSGKCAGHSIRLGPWETPRTSAGSRGVGCWDGLLLAGSECCQHLLFFFGEELCCAHGLWLQK